VPYFMDRHDLPGITPQEVAQAHLQDLNVQERFGVRYLSYWFDYERQAAFCLVEAPDEKQAVAVHAAAHGLLPSRIIPVDRGTVEMFLGRIVDPSETGVATSGFRVIMFTDMEGSTNITQRLGDDAAMVLLRRHDSITRTALDAYQGSEVKHTGDGIMASFGSVTNSLSCSIAIQRAIAAHNQEAAADDGFLVRIGIAAGEPVTEQGDMFGAAVQLAARLCSSASAGEICLTDTLRGLAIGKRFEFTAPRELSLKGFDEPIRAVLLRWTEGAEAL
jgi:class 3 adenylate cyclase